MTARDVLSRRKRWVMYAAVLGGGFFVVGGYLGAAFGEPTWFLFGVPGFVVAFLVLLWAQHFGLRCPWCRGNVAPLAFRRLGLSFDQRIQFCPFCGRQFDEELEEAAPVNTTDQADW